MPLRAVLVDLDETLYAPGAALIRTVDARITAFIAIRTGLSWPRADELRRALWWEYGTTARGLNRLFDISERDLNRFAVDSVDPRPHVRPDPALAGHLARIPAPCHLFTNATRRYAERVLAVLGVRECLERIFDIEFSLFNPKPAPIFYRRAV
ncbi:MAG: pyrimidine 5'-nucleotidase, partial [Armatimonadetes bacterium]|nr:pyrimidine 5'-nucleotidase [Armatimonadota bacterium]